MTNEVKQRPLVVFRYPGRQVGEWSYTVLQPSLNNPDVYEIASSWFDSEAEGLAELQAMRERRGEG